MNDISSERAIGFEIVEVRSPRTHGIGFNALMGARGTNLDADDAPTQELFRESARAIGIVK